ncbi:hypothetical protein DIPPA_33221 [Diplonema papillatum]|nr:hypothetical protein DIPPA_33221 [Diplonema papillatum]
MMLRVLRVPLLARQRRFCGKTVTSNDRSAFVEANGPTPREVGNSTEAGKVEVVWDNCDTAGDIKAEMAMEGFEDVEVKPEHYALAVRAFAYGTIVAVLIVSGLSYVAGWFIGVSDYREALAYMRDAPHREAQAAIDRGEATYRHEIDLLNPSSWKDAWNGIIVDLEKIEREHRVADDSENENEKASV